MQQSAAKLQGQAQQALAAGREDLAREALTRRAAVTSQMGDLQGQQASLQAEQDKLTVASQRLQAQVEAFRTRKETIKAAYTAADAETRIREAVTGISEEMGDVGMAVQRAQDKTEQMQARAGALDELLASGALEDATVPGGRDEIQSQLDALTAGHDVDDELARMKAQLRPRLPRRPSRAPDGISRSAATAGRRRERALVAPAATASLRRMAASEYPPQTLRRADCSQRSPCRRTARPRLMLNAERARPSNGSRAQCRRMHRRSGAKDQRSRRSRTGDLCRDHKLAGSPFMTSPESRSGRRPSARG